MVLGPIFYLTCLEIVKEDVVAAVRDFFPSSSLPLFYSSSYIVFIPKAEEPKSFDKSRPISLCSVAYKTFSKVLVQRMTHLLPQLIFS